MTVDERIEENGYEEVKVLRDFSYDSALIGITDDGRAVYDYELMVEWLMKEEGWSYEDSAEWISYNTLRALPYFGEGAPIVINRLDDVSIRVDDV